MTDSASHLALGTIQFGLPYGVANRSGQVPREDAAEILTRARAAGLDTIDTAMAYGESEQRIGSIGVSGWKVVTKLPPLPSFAASDPAGWARSSLAASLERLGLDAVYGLLLHRSQDLLEEQGKKLYGALTAMKGEGLTAKIGVSIYDPEELDAIRDEYPVDVVQAPFNVIDRRLQTSGWLEELRRQGVEVHTRSAFLQGLLLLDPSDRPPAFARWQHLWKRWDAWLADEKLTAVEGSLRFVLGQEEIGRVVVGVDSPAQFAEILAAAEGPVPRPPDDLSSDDHDLVIPSRWARQ